LNRKLVLIGVGALAVVAIVGVVIFGILLREPEAASGPLSALPIVVATSGAAATPGATAQAQAAAGSQFGTAAPGAAAAAGSDQLIFQIVPDQSEARFQLSEVLRGQPNTVVGKTNQIAGQIAISPKDLSATQLGKIQVNARTLATDEDRRNRAIQNFILNTNSYELITFEPTSIKGLSGAAALGQPYNFEIAGNLTIRDVTHPVVFKATAQAESADRLVGNASAVIKRSDYNLTIPNVPFVANVGEDVTVELDFVATPVQQ
jgi:polyisoprenoid-binding protein YceI